jgi:hypothetical protein
MTNETNETNVQTFPVLSLTHGETLKTGMNGMQWFKVGQH